MQNLNSSSVRNNFEQKTRQNNNINKRLLYIDPISGISGDMFLAACVDLGVNQIALIESLQSLPIDPFSISFNTVSKKGIRALATSITFSQACHNNHEHRNNYEHHTHRHLRDIHEIINSSSLTDNAKSLALAIFQVIAQAEASIHNTSIEKVHFHEVGAMDSIIDIVGAAICLDSLQVDEVVCGHVPTGFGTVHCEHGQFPIPAPATLEILTGVPIRNVPIEAELTTPTGAAIIKCSATTYSAQLPDMVVDRIGYGAGSRDLDRPNVVRLVLGHTATEEISLTDTSYHSTPKTPTTMWMLEATIDDMQPEIYQHIINQLLMNGANDVMVIPAIVKKDRAGCLLRVLTADAHVPKLKELIFKQTTTLGIRSWEILRDELERNFHEIMVDGYAVSIKVGYLNNEIVTVAPEYEDCKKVALATDVPLKIVYQKAIAAYYKQ